MWETLSHPLSLCLSHTHEEAVKDPTGEMQVVDQMMDRSREETH